LNFFSFASTALPILAFAFPASGAARDLGERLLSIRSTSLMVNTRTFWFKRCFGRSGIERFETSQISS